jgi:hypothetical protein
MAKFIKIAYKTLEKMLKQARKNGAQGLVGDIQETLASGPIGRGFSSKARAAARAEGKYILPKSDFQNLLRAAGMEDGVRITRPGEFEGIKGARSTVDEIRALRGKGSYRSKTDARGTTTTFMPRGGGMGRKEPKSMLRSEEEDMLAFNRAEDRAAARMGRKVDRREFGR